VVATRMVRAQTHPAAYLLHKYWSRKPHNVLAALFARHPSRGLFVDPFCGSGVALSEAAALGFECVGGDVNPVARLLTGVTLEPPDPRAAEERISSVIHSADAAFGSLYAVRGEPHALRFARHATVVRCQACGRAVTAVRSGRRYACPLCGGRVRVNLEHLIATEVTGVATAGGCSDDRDLCAEQLRLSEAAEADGAFDFSFPVNRRTLSFDGLTTRRLFTPRNFACLSFLARAFHTLDPGVRAAALVLLTSTVAQCSRLVASRNDLRTGGQAWTVPGFWVPPTHLETNPLGQIRTRLGKLVRGLAELRAMPGRSRPQVAGSADELLGSLRDAGRKADLVFLDPPYGDSVPYLEFSALWNSFLGLRPDCDLDIAVTDRGDREASWIRYEQALGAHVATIAALLAPSGSVIATFNNRDARAWKALLGATQAAGLFAERAEYGAPAVVPTKAQLAPEGSYGGDFYCVLRRGRRAATRDLSPVASALRGARGSDQTLRRLAITAFLEHHVAAELVAEIDPLVKGRR
jgi:DNA-directed RNA polymerase subunit RPC12/RpoP